jgi:hypothetical protein
MTLRVPAVALVSITGRPSWRSGAAGPRRWVPPPFAVASSASTLGVPAPRVAGGTALGRRGPTCAW